MIRPRFRWTAVSVRLLTAAALLTLASPIRAQAPGEIKGEAILKHPIGALALKAAELLAAGRIDEVFALRTKSEQADWKGASAGERKEVGDRLKSRAPDPKTLPAALRASGILNIEGNEATLRATTPTGDMLASFEMEGGAWKSSSGPMVLGGSAAAAPANETRITGPAILKHPIGPVALQYVDLVHGGKIDEAMKLASTKAQADWKANPASERTASAEFRRKILPTRSELNTALQSGGTLIVEGNERATLNIIRIEQKSAAPGSVNASSTTVGIPFVMEGGQWKVAQ